MNSKSTKPDFLIQTIITIKSVYKVFGILNVTNFREPEMFIQFIIIIISVSDALGGLNGIQTLWNLKTKLS
jgi:hypothetical protein